NSIVHGLSLPFLTWCTVVGHCLPKTLLPFCITGSTITFAAVSNITDAVPIRTCPSTINTPCVRANAGRIAILASLQDFSLSISSCSGFTCAFRSQLSSGATSRTSAWCDMAPRPGGAINGIWFRNIEDAIEQRSTVVLHRRNLHRLVPGNIREQTHRGNSDDG